MKLRPFVILSLLFLFFNLKAQHFNSIPFIQNYSPQDYNAGNQNWSIIQDNRGVMYFGNTKGILEFDGRTWEEIDPAYIVTAEKNKEGKIFVGGKEVFGFLQPDAIGKTKLKRLNHLLPDTISNFLYVRYIIFEDSITSFFDESGWKFTYINNKIRIEKIASKIGYVSKINDEIFIQTSKGLGKLEKGTFHLIDKQNIVADKNIQFITSFNSKIIVVTRLNGIYEITDEGIKEWKINYSSFLKKNQVYKATKIDDDFLIFGTVESGVLVIDKSGNKILHLNSENGMLNHDHCAIYVDDRNNIWSGLEYGISYINFNSPFSYIDAANGLNNSAIYSITLHENDLYVGTARGVYYSKWDYTKSNNESELNFYLVPGNAGRKAWDFINDGNYLLCGSSNIGTYKIENYEAKPILSKYSIEKFLLLKNNKILIGATEHGGLVVLKNHAENWEIIKHFNEITFTKYIEEDTEENIWIDVYQKGIAKIKFNDSYNKIDSLTYYNTDNGLPCVNDLTVINLFDQIVIGTKKGSHIYSTEKDIFIPYTKLNEKLGFETQLKSLKSDRNGMLWFWGQDENIDHIGIIQKENNSYIIESNKNSLAHISDYENFSFYPINKELVFIGSSDKLILFNSNHEFLVDNKLNIYFRSVELIANKDSIIFSESHVNAGIKKEPVELDFENNALRFRFAAIDYENPSKTMYSYKLDGFDKNWSSFTEKAEKEYTNIPDGHYTFMVKAKNIYNIESNIAQYSFNVLAPWYKTKIAIVGYIIILLVLIYFIIKVSIRRVDRERKKLEKIVQRRTKEISEQRDEILQQRDEIETQHDIISFHRKKILDSIDYAKQIQGSLLPPEKKFNTYFKEHFLLYKPKDIVSGDFYWLKKVNNTIIIAAADSTGHGVPGAFMSILGISFLNEILRQQEFNSPALVLEELRNKTMSSFHQLYDIDEDIDSTDFYIKSEITDGIDIALCAIDQNTMIMEYAGANNPVYIVRNGEIIETEPTINPIGIFIKYLPFTNHKIQLLEGDILYLFSDGYADQFGGDDGFKYNLTKFHELLLRIYTLPMEKQKLILEDTIKRWQGENNQVDDIMVIGIKI